MTAEAGTGPEQSIARAREQAKVVAKDLAEAKGMEAMQGVEDMATGES